MSGASTDQILGTDATGYVASYGEQEDSLAALQADNAFCIVYSDSKSGKIRGYGGLILVVASRWSGLDGELLLYKDGKMNEVPSEHDQP